MSTTARNAFLCAAIFCTLIFGTSLASANTVLTFEPQAVLGTNGAGVLKAEIPIQQAYGDNVVTNNDASSPYRYGGAKNTPNIKVSYAPWNIDPQGRGVRFLDEFSIGAPNNYGPTGDLTNVLYNAFGQTTKWTVTFTSDNPLFDVKLNSFDVAGVADAPGNPGNAPLISPLISVVGDTTVNYANVSLPVLAAAGHTHLSPGVTGHCITVILNDPPSPQLYNMVADNFDFDQVPTASTVLTFEPQAVLGTNGLGVLKAEIPIQQAYGDNVVTNNDAISPYRYGGAKNTPNIKVSYAPWNIDPQGRGVRFLDEFSIGAPNNYGPTGDLTNVLYNAFGQTTNWTVTFTSDNPQFDVKVSSFDLAGVADAPGNPGNAPLVSPLISVVGDTTVNYTNVSLPVLAADGHTMLSPCVVGHSVTVILNDPPSPQLYNMVADNFKFLQVPAQNTVLTFEPQAVLGTNGAGVLKAEIPIQQAYGDNVVLNNDALSPYRYGGAKNTPNIKVSYAPWNIDPQGRGVRFLDEFSIGAPNNYGPTGDLTNVLYNAFGQTTNWTVTFTSDNPLFDVQVNSFDVAGVADAPGNPSNAPLVSPLISVVGDTTVNYANVSLPVLAAAGHTHLSPGVTGHSVTVILNDPPAPQLYNMVADNFDFTQIPANPVISISQGAGGNLTISWTGTGVLEQADTVTGRTWSTAASQANPQTVTPTVPARFFRIRKL